MTTPATPPADSPSARLAVNAPWLVKLRWVALLGQLATVLFVAYGLGVPLAVRPLAAALAVTGVTNVVLEWWVRGALRQQHASSRMASATIAGVMLLDLVVLTFMLYVTGGPTNPFVVFYFVNLALAGVLLEASLAWMLAGVACLGMATLFWMRWPVLVLSDPARLTTMASEERLPLAAVGDFVALVTGSGVIVAFMTRVTTELRASQQARRRAEERRARSEKLEALGTLAAGAAHELATPLSTIAVVATEVERELAGLDLPESVTSDLALVRSELQRCRTILDRMSVDVGHSIGEALAQIELGELVQTVFSGLSSDDRVDYAPDPTVQKLTLRVPRVALAQALRALVQNGLDASDTGVTVAAMHVADGVQLVITDQGLGMDREQLARAGEPFFTTKQPGQGMGLGLFLARSVIERLGGSLEIRSTPGEGTQAVVQVPMAE